ncbi:hypothetical protein FQR65_LT17589 [Abscondita terminalis]|nr:hypothetical protein FQR65_LT17589 [Abscondita terminalis]
MRPSDSCIVFMMSFVGCSGAGKSTVINLGWIKFLCRPSFRSDVLLDGVDLAEYDTAFLRENIGLVLQRNHIFKGSVAENIRYGKPDATMEEVVYAAKQAYIHDQILELPDGYESEAHLMSGVSSKG